MVSFAPFFYRTIFHKLMIRMIAGIRNRTNVTIGADFLHNMKLLDNPWHHAEAYHFLLLCQSQLLQGTQWTKVSTICIFSFLKILEVPKFSQNLSVTSSLLHIYLSAPSLDLRLQYPLVIMSKGLNFH